MKVKFETKTFSINLDLDIQHFRIDKDQLERHPRLVDSVNRGRGQKKDRKAKEDFQKQRDVGRAPASLLQRRRHAASVTLRHGKDLRRPVARPMWRSGRSQVCLSR